MQSTPAAYAAAYRHALDEATALATTLTAAQFNWKPSPDVWSVAECFVHLNRTNAGYPDAMARALGRANQAAPGASPYRYGPVARRFIAATGPEGKKSRTFGPMRPTPGTDYAPDRVLADFRVLTDGLLAVADRAVREGLDVSRIRIGSPSLPVLRLPVGAFLEALAGHEHRHLAQARRVAEHPGFPR